tara:strand:+ start:13188 stop:13880 length:693 start_codon:yes stop_codon:yes gene_type:complete
MVKNEILEKTLLLVPTYNEGNELNKTLEDLRRYFPNILLIDDGSTDQSISKTNLSNIYLIKHLINLGQGRSLETGFKFFLKNINYHYLITFDSDGQHRPKDALKMLTYLKNNNFDFVLGSRFIKNNNIYIPLLKKIILKIGVLFENYRSKLKLTDAHNGLRLLNRKAVASLIPIKCSRMAHASEIVYKLGNSKLKGSEYPVTIIYKNKKSQSPLNFMKILFEIYLNEYLR